MKRNFSTSVFIFALCIMVSSGFAADKVVDLKIGTAWPQALLSTGTPSGNAEFEYGTIVDRKIGFGLAVDFLWNVQSKIERDTASLHYKTISNQQTYMLPVMGFIFIDPVPDLIVHPVARFQIGYNSMLYTVKMDSTLAQNSPQTLSPYFYGLILKASIDALYNLGKNSALFLGLEYQWANTSTANTQSGLFDQRDMSGVGLRAGFRVTL